MTRWRMETRSRRNESSTARLGESRGVSAKLPKLFGAELGRGAIAEARNILAFGLRPPPAGVRDDCKKESAFRCGESAGVAHSASSDRRQDNLPSDDSLPSAERERARRPFFDLAAIDAQSGQRRVETVASELANVASELSPAERTTKDPARCRTPHITISGEHTAARSR